MEVQCTSSLIPRPSSLALGERLVHELIREYLPQEERDNELYKAMSQTLYT